MAVVDDLNHIAFLCGKVVRITNAAAATKASVENVDNVDGEPEYTLTNAQRTSKLAERSAYITQIKTLAAGLPGA